MPVESVESVSVTKVSVGNKSVKDAAASTKVICDTSNFDWCYKCQKFYNTCREVAAQHGIRVVDGLFNSKIVLKCEKKEH